MRLIINSSDVAEVQVGVFQEIKTLGLIPFICSNICSSDVDSVIVLHTYKSASSSSS